jgi:hypothetical protein
MLINNFLIYIGSFFAASISLAVLVKKITPGFEVSGKRPFVSGFVSSALVSIGAYLTTLVSRDQFKLFWLLGGLYLLFGILHTSFFHKRFFISHQYNRGKTFLGEIIFGLSLVFFTVVVFSALQYFFRDKFFLFYPLLLSGFMFFVPLLLLKSFEAAYDIPGTVYQTWEYPLYQPIELPDETSYDRLMVIGFEIAKNTRRKKRTYFRAKAPEGMKLGDLFYHFINDYNDLNTETTIEYSNGGSEAYEWWFRAKTKWYKGKQVLNPNITVRENKIRENTVIICERLQNPNN